MLNTLKHAALAGGLLMVTACATTLEADGRLDAARDRVEAAAEYGTSRSAYTRATGFLSDAEAALESGDATVYDKSVDLGDAYAQIAIAEGVAEEAREAADGMSSDLSAAQDGVMQCQADLAACEATVEAMAGSMGETLSMLAGTMRCTRTDMGDAVTLSCPGLGFGFDQSQLNVATDARLTALAEFLKAHGGVSVELVGHTDTTGPETWNQSLSERRAASASQFLENEGVDASRIATSGRGEAEPIASNDTREGRSRNRRVDVILRGLGGGSMESSVEEI